MSEHTPLPWKASEHEPGIVLGPHGIAICGCFTQRPPGTNRGEAAANAALIVRAVNAHADLLAACERAAAILRPEVEPMTFERQATYSLLRAALEKARGD